jgi:uncharacterized membrane protein YvbJ
MRWLIRVLLPLSFLLLTACAANQSSLSEEFDRSTKAYNRLLRWHEVESAVMTYSDQDTLEESLKKAETLKKRGVSVTDFRILSSKYFQEKKSGTVVTEFDYFILPSNRIKTITNRQEWIYRENINIWKLKSGLPDFE